MFTQKLLKSKYIFIDVVCLSEARPCDLIVRFILNAYVFLIGHLKSALVEMCVCLLNVSLYNATAGIYLFIFYSIRSSAVSENSKGAYQPTLSDKGISLLSAHRYNCRMLFAYAFRHGNLQSGQRSAFVVRR